METKTELLGLRLTPGTTAELKQRAHQYGVRHTDIVRWAIGLIITDQISPANAFGLGLKINNGGPQREKQNTP